MAEKSENQEVLDVQFYSPVFNGKWHGLLVTSPKGTPIWISVPNVLFGKGKRYFYDVEKKTLSLPSGSGYDAEPIDFVMGLKKLTVFADK